MKKFQSILFAVLLIIALSACNLETNVSKTQSLKSNDGDPSQIANIAEKQRTPMQSLIAENIESLQVVGGLPATKHSPLFQNTEESGKSTITKVVGWIHSAEPVSGQTEYGKHGYPMAISIKMDDGKMLSIEPAYDCVTQKNSDGSGSKTCNPIKDEIIYSNDSIKIRAKSPELYEWLKKGWKQEK
ncbi:hypothetical protein M3647_21185 [Paenibacillus cellulositrophicus]|uniref:hypothetical protein n=1 Tax=Paenibacillus cellulositrophicus TaxID=562959 RepID=UPI00203D6430|nr:hypothetical protein [Paenibacillus cellulositrophicus]MCM2999993.1 hypothetical protein [Paenibacillus cellulositrophicus]